MQEGALLFFAIAAGAILPPLVLLALRAMARYTCGRASACHTKPQASSPPHTIAFDRFYSARGPTMSAMGVQTELQQRYPSGSQDSGQQAPTSDQLLALESSLFVHVGNPPQGADAGQRPPVSEAEQAAAMQQSWRAAQTANRLTVLPGYVLAPAVDMHPGAVKRGVYLRFYTWDPVKYRPKNLVQ